MDQHYVKIPTQSLSQVNDVTLSSWDLTYITKELFTLLFYFSMVQRLLEGSPQRFFRVIFAIAGPYVFINTPPVDESFRTSSISNVFNICEEKRLFLLER